MRLMSARVDDSFFLLRGLPMMVCRSARRGWCWFAFLGPLVALFVAIVVVIILTIVLINAFRPHHQPSAPAVSSIDPTQDRKQAATS